MADADKSYYVYTLIDPRNDSIFYVGKGKGRRLSAHVKNYKKGKIDNVNKHKKIKEIVESGFNVIERIVCNDMLETDAYKLERNLISEYKQKGLTNIVGGIVTNQELQRELVNQMLNRVKPFELWVKSIDEETKSLVINVFGGLKECHEKFVHDLTVLVNSYAHN